MAIQTEELAANGTCVSKELDVTLSLSMHKNNTEALATLVQ